MIRIDIINADTAFACGRTVKSSKGPINALARQLIADGYAAHDITEVYHGHKRAFKDTPLSYWADHSYREGDASVKRVRYVPMPTDLHQEQS